MYMQGTWKDVLGCTCRYGLVEVNTEGKSILEFSLIFNLTIANT